MSAMRSHFLTMSSVLWPSAWLLSAPKTELRGSKYHQRFCQAIDTSCTQTQMPMHIAYVDSCSFFKCLDSDVRFICCISTTVSYTRKYPPILSCTCELAQLPQVPTCVCNLASSFLSFSTPCDIIKRVGGRVP